MVITTKYDGQRGKKNEFLTKDCSFSFYLTIHMNTEPLKFKLMSHELYIYEN
jgi:hypothetical protein